MVDFVLLSSFLFSVGSKYTKFLKHILFTCALSKNYEKYIKSDLKAYIALK